MALAGEKDHVGYRELGQICRECGCTCLSRHTNTPAAVLQARTPRASGLAQLTSRGRIAADEGDFHALRRESNSDGAAYISGSKDGDLHSALGNVIDFCARWLCRSHAPTRFTFTQTFIRCNWWVYTQGRLTDLE